MPATTNTLRQCAAEMIGTFILVFAGTGAIVVNHVHGGAVTHAGVAIVFGLVVMAMIYALGETSGAHLNPAVTLGFWVARRFPGISVAPYLASQLVGAFLATAVLRVMFTGSKTLGETLPTGTALQSFALEAILTAILMFVVLCVSCGSKEIGVMAGIAVGGVIGLEAMFGGPVSGASMNPARSLAPAVISGRLEFVWIYLAAPVLGALAAVPCWKFTRSN